MIVALVTATMLSAGLGPVLAHQPGDPVEDSPEAALTSARRSTSAAWDDGSRAYIVGGTLSDGSASADILAYETTNSTVWHRASLPDAVLKEQTADPQGRTETSAVWTGTKLLVFGGKTGLTTDDPSLIDDIVVWDPAAGTFTVRSGTGPGFEDGLPYGLAGTSAVWTGEEAYIFGGVNATADAGGIGDVSTNILEFTPDADADNNAATQAGASLPTGLAFTSAVWDDDQGVAYVFGGVDADGNAKDAVYEFDPSGPTVEEVGTLDTARGYTSAVWDGTAAFVFGGENASHFETVERFVPGSGVDAWHDLPGARARTSAVFDASTGNASLFGGTDGSALDAIANYTVAPVEHQPDIVSAEPYPPNATTLSGGRTVIDEATFRIRNDHPACDSGTVVEVGCRVPAGVNVSVFVRSQAELEDSSGAISSATLSNLAQNLDAIENDIITGSEPAKTVTTLSPIEGDKNRKVTVNGIDISRFDHGDVVTVIAVADWCEQRYLDGVDDDDPPNDHPCDVDEEGSEQNILFHQWIVRPSLDVTVERASPLPGEDLVAAEGESTEVLVNVTNNGLASLADRELTLDYTLTPSGTDTGCPEGAQEGGDDPCHTTIPGPDAGQTVSERIHWDNKVAGERRLDVVIGYPNVADDADQPVNHPSTETATETYTYLGVDWTAAQTVATADGDPGATAIRVDATIANVGDLAAEDSGVDQPVEMGWHRCNLLLHPGEDYRCKTSIDDHWDLLNGSGDSTHEFPLSSFPPGGSADETIFWGTDEQAPGAWVVRSRADNQRHWVTLEHTTANNDARDRVRLSNVSWDVDERPLREEFADPDADALDFSVPLTHENPSETTLEILRVNASCNPECDKGWEFHLVNETGDQLDDDGQVWYPRPNKDQTPVRVDVGADETESLMFRVIPPSGRVQPDHFVNATLVVCEAEPGFEDDGTCEANGDLIRTRAFFDPPWNPRIVPQSPEQVTVDAGGTATFFFKARNGADDADDAFRLEADISPAGAGQTEWARLDPISETCTDPKLTVNPAAPDAAGCDDVEALSMAPGEDNRFRLRVTVNENLPDGTIVHANVTATSRQSEIGDGSTVTKTRPFEIGVGTDIAPPRINATPPSGAVVRPGDGIAFNVTDDGDITSVERRIDDGRFEAVDDTQFVVPTAGRPDGALKIDVRARDDADHQQTRTFRYTVDGTPPSIQALRLDPSIVSVDGEIDVTVGLSEDNPGSVVARTGGTDHELTLDESSGLFEVQGIPAPDDPGIYSLEVVATDQAGNLASENASYEVVEPDLSIAAEDVTAEPRSPTAGTTLTVTAKVANPTGAEIEGYPVELLVDEETVASTDATLVPNAKTAVTLEWTAEAGGHTLSVCADPAETLQDADRSNQCADLSVRVREQSLIPGPEIVIIAAALVLGALGRRRWDARDADEGYPRD